MAEQKNNNLIPRPPVVVVMGHVDHGKTKLLDYIRKTSVAEGEAGGITQHIGAYEIIHKNKKITFLDTPGHEAFSKLRARGAKAADIAVLVVAADDGVKPQTLEALEHIKSAELPFIVAINKIDKPESSPERVKKELAEHDVLVESWGGKIPSVEIAAKPGTNVGELLDLIELLADLGELKGNPDKSAEGVVIETNLDSRRGFVASLLILDGTMETGDYILSGTATGKIKILENFLGNPIKKAAFSSPVLVVGFNELPLIGDKFITEKIPFTVTLKVAKKIGELIEKSVESTEEKSNYVHLIIKGDVQSSVEALKESFEKMQFSPFGGSPEGGENAAIKVLKAEVGNVIESDFKTAIIGDALIIAFNVKIETAIFGTEKEKIPVISGNIIYDVLDKAEAIIKEKLKPKTTREETGRLQVLAIFRQEKNRQVVGGKVISGEIVKGSRFEIIRNDIIMGQGRIAGLQSEKKEVGKIEAGKEAGLEIDFGDPKIAIGDILMLFRKLP
ncbi:translation initiation factor IF-2 [Candidatus Azambacteria bacterium RIFOXYD1_FULL_42_11]|uniref:Translation initiation factor IF-2 n=4 Tax=Candidatus Azamiibacteriota TaxID=1752741 RepID=A0A0G0ZCB5_9BACT|nr:MAG: Translation initiation factor IF-2 [Candidatus Azambacteria bacterium GW2011_GWB1_42_17]KKS46380.1 MAG: Translation initiation factor IF-2 [Candidatus Azambacteria bacterium GW2011_GWA1_42_19]KKS76015.1 MAG: Translation initiation factor IF-2 [Candidatus Azambacteria bacterium GW2011_GWA2_42_9]KKS88778.1 MAG: Translation initiation factor IF-2 [Parcubacteria group bacterium GW2011_GWC1_43_11]OGD43029.1 MAG: translation initiation factor IF-2 [Candidatus Azambacteria bacterium RIFOXYD1_F